MVLCEECKGGKLEGQGGQILQSSEGHQHAQKLQGARALINSAYFRPSREKPTVSAPIVPFAIHRYRDKAHSRSSRDAARLECNRNFHPKRCCNWLSKIPAPRSASHKAHEVRQDNSQVSFSDVNCAVRTYSFHHGTPVYDIFPAAFLSLNAIPNCIPLNYPASSASTWVQIASSSRSACKAVIRDCRAH